MALNIVFDLNADIARPKKLDVAAACGNFVGFAFIEKLVLLQARQRMVVLNSGFDKSPGITVSSAT